MGNTPELYFVLAVAGFLGLMALMCVTAVVCFALTCVDEWRRWKRQDSAHKARLEIIAREQISVNQQLKNKANEAYWRDMLKEIDKEYRGN